MAVKSSLLTLVFTDLGGSTALKTRLGDHEAGALITRHQERVRQLVIETKGRKVDCPGDGFFFTFETPSAAVTFALRLQQIHHAEPELSAQDSGKGEPTGRVVAVRSSWPSRIRSLEGTRLTYQRRRPLSESTRLRVRGRSCGLATACESLHSSSALGTSAISGRTETGRPGLLVRTGTPPSP